MDILNFGQSSPLGDVQSVDTSNVVVRVTDKSALSRLQVNHLVVIESSKIGRKLIGLVNKIVRKYTNEPDAEASELDEDALVNDIVKISLIGTYLKKQGTEHNIFKRTLESVPEIASKCFMLSDKMLSDFMQVISTKNLADIDQPLLIGNYTLNDDAKAYLDGDKLFQRHAVIVGSTGSGKSYTVANVIEQTAKLKSANAILFDIHGEYQPLAGNGIQCFKIAGPNDSLGENNIFLPYWLLTYEEMVALMLDRSDDNAPNQAMMFSNAVIKGKKKHLESNSRLDLVDVITLDSPVPYNIATLLSEFKEENVKMEPGATAKGKQGPYFGKLTRFIQRLESKAGDKRLNFMFSSDAELLKSSYMVDLCNKLLKTSTPDFDGVKIIDFSEVPSDILPLVASLISRLVFSVQQWMDKSKIHPIAIFCDEAHLYIPQLTTHTLESSSLQSFERIAKEGRKYGVALIVISQRPAEVNRTVLSQAGNFIAMRLTNADDQNVVKKLLPDSLGDFAELLPILDIGEALVVGDASLLPSRIVVNQPIKKPNSNTMKFWQEWSKETTETDINEAVASLIRQSK
ncbi:MAG: ATP-binding protein [Defluviitaleaceae bacterium]|nr:ATP-binding protein [Defluviitaleaceae bacterium]